MLGILQVRLPDSQHISTLLIKRGEKSEQIPWIVWNPNVHQRCTVYSVH